MLRSGHGGGGDNGMENTVYIHSAVCDGFPLDGVSPEYTTPGNSDKTGWVVFVNVLLVSICRV